MTPKPPTAHVCRVCRQPLSFYQPDSESPDGQWFHGTASDHNPVPVPRLEMNDRELRPICDFCTTETDVETSWVYPATAFAVEGQMKNFKHTIADDGEGWGACARCHAFIEAGDRDGLASRAASIAERRHGVPFEELLPHVRLAHDTFFLTATAPAYPAREYRNG